MKHELELGFYLLLLKMGIAVRSYIHRGSMRNQVNTMVCGSRRWKLLRGLKEEMKAINEFLNDGINVGVDHRIVVVKDSNMKV